MNNRCIQITIISTSRATLRKTLRRKKSFCDYYSSVVRSLASAVRGSGTKGRALEERPNRKHSTSPVSLSARELLEKTTETSEGVKERRAWRASFIRICTSVHARERRIAMFALHLKEL